MSKHKKKTVYVVSARKYKLFMFFVAVLMLTAAAVTMVLQESDSVMRQRPADSGVYSFSYEAKGASSGEEDADEVYYSDDFFSKDNGEYDHDLGRVSLALSMTAFNEDNVMDFIEVLGFGSPVPYRYDQNGDEDKAAVAFSHKETGSGIVLMAAIRGGGYGDEWGSNGRIGYEGEAFGYHYGFHKAAEDAIVQLKEYAADNDIDLGDSVVWLTGFSRGAAVANIMGFLLLEEGTVSPEKMFDYTFATPSTVSESLLEDKSVRGIYNIINPLDIVTRLPMNAAGVSQTSKGDEVRYEWDYTKYGNILELPSASEKAQLQLVELLERALAFAARNEIYYVENIQDKVMVPALKKAMGKGTDISKRNVGYVLVDVLPGVTAFLKNELNQMGIATQIYVAGILSGKKSIRLEKEHWPETYWGWMVKVDSLE